MIPAGSLDDAAPIAPQARMFSDSRASWSCTDDELTEYPECRRRTDERGVDALAVWHAALCDASSRWVVVGEGPRADQADEQEWDEGGEYPEARGFGGGDGEGAGGDDHDSLCPVRSLGVSAAADFPGLTPVQRVLPRCYNLL